MGDSKKYRQQFTLTAFLSLFVAVWSAMTLLGYVLGLLVVVLYLTILFRSIRPKKDNSNTLAELIGALTIITAIIQLGLPAWESAYRNKHTKRSRNQLTAVAKAINAYHVTHGQFPPACVRDDNGRPMHSWRVLILPELGYQDLYDTYRFDEPWNSPHNRSLLKSVPDEYWCYMMPAGFGNGITTFVAIVGQETMWPEGRNMKSADIHDGVGQTIMIGEVSPHLGIEWLEPRDISFEKAALGFHRASRPIQGGTVNKLLAAHRSPVNELDGTRVAQVVTADGRVQKLPEDLPPDTIRALLTASGGEPIDIDAIVVKPPSKVGKIISAVLLIFSLTVMTVSVTRHRQTLVAEQKVNSDRLSSDVVETDAAETNEDANPSGTA